MRNACQDEGRTIYRVAKLAALATLTFVVCAAGALFLRDNVAQRAASVPVVRISPRPLPAHWRDVGGDEGQVARR